jgi:predicted transposase/invertase (TIGR01784 family)
MVILPNRLISMLSDFGFKMTFGNQKDHTFIRKALPLLLKLPLKIRKIKYLPTEFLGITESSRKGFYDTFFVVNEELYFIVEMQLGNHANLLERLMYYLSFLYVSKIKKGKKAFINVKKVHCICITRDTLFPTTKEYYHKSNFRSETGLLISDKMEFIFVELEKFTKLAANLDNEFEELLFTMKNAHTIDLDEATYVPTFWKKPWLKKALKELNLSKMSSENRLAYELNYARLIGLAQQEEIEEKEKDAKRDAAFEAKMRQREMEREAESRQREIEREAESRQREIEREAESRQREIEREAESRQREIEREVERKKVAIEKALIRGKLSLVEIAEDNEVTVEDVLAIQQKMA